MTQYRRRMGFYEAREIMARVGCELSADYHTLGAEQVDRVVVEAHLYGYRRPRNAPGSTARMFFQFVQRVAHRRAG